ncbi:MAG: trypsin-like peptidase domain-containing protein [Leptospira sp.]|nr:trypsin-like peptidase domain-containing protein [Leptospira sp.]
MGAGGSGFIIEGNQVLTNAHVVSNAKFIQIQRYNQTEWFEAKVKFIAHDCDLAILEATGEDFYEGSIPLEIGDIPELNTPVLVVGFPIGGSKISVSRGIVSRKEQSTYAHSQVDSHLVIQVDAAINPGNSGGPAIQDNKVVGVAFQVASKGENIGYIIPTTVVNHFLKDISNGVYDGYVELGIRYTNSFNKDYREALKIPDTLEGVWVTRVFAGGSAHNYLHEGDLLLSLDGKKIARNGTVKLDRDTRIEFIEIIDNKFAGDKIQFEIYRNGKKMTLDFPAKRMPDFDYMRHSYDKPYPYVLVGGLVFQEMSRDLLIAWGRGSNTSGGSQLLYRFYNFIEDGWNGKKKSDVVFYRKLDHPINSHAEYFQNLIVTKANGKEINELSDLESVVKDSKSKYLKLEFLDLNFPLVIDLEKARLADIEIKRSYNVPE